MASSGRGSGDRRDDAELVLAARAGDREAFAALYDRHVDRIHTMCVHLLGDRDDAADVTAEVFLTAAERLGQLREPSRVRPWLFAIARRQVYLRTRRRSRTVPVEELDDMGHDDLSTDADAVESAAAAGEVAALVRAAAAGLDDGDRVVLELTLHGLEGSDLADALGVPAPNAHQAAHRMRERLERSVGALLVARQGRGECPDLDRLLAGWDGRFSVLWRKRVARHVDRCETCERRRRLVPAMVLQGVAGATPVVAAPISLRTRVLDEVRLGGSGGPSWRADGFPPPDGRRAGRATGLAAAVVLAVVLLAAAVVAGWPDGAAPDGPLADAAPGPAAGAGVPAAGPAPTVLGATDEAVDPGATTSVAPDPSTGAGAAAGSGTPGAPGAPSPAPAPAPAPAPGTVPPSAAPPPSGQAPPAAPTGAIPEPGPPAGGTPAPPSTTTTTTVPVDRTPPSVTLTGATTGPCRGTTYLARVADTSAVSTVVLTWRSSSGTTGRLAMTGAGPAWTAVLPALRDAGPFVLTAAATDSAGNVGTSPPLTVCPTG